MASETTDSSDQFSPLMSNIKKELINGVVYQKWWAEIPIEEELKKMKDFEVFDDDVLTVGFPRSGNHWTYDVVYMIRHQTTEFAPKIFVEDLLDARLSTSVGLDDFPRPRNLVMHNRPRWFPTQTTDKRIKIIFLLRNPKDVIASLFKYCSDMKERADRFEGSWEDFLELCLNGQFTFGSWFEHTLDVEKFIDDNPQIPTYVHVFENMIEKPVESIRRLCAFLEKPDTLAEEIAEAVEFKHMKETAKKYEKFRKLLFGDNPNCPGVLRKGVIGDWKNKFTIAQNERFNQVYKEKMAGFRLGKLIEKYLELE